MSNNENKNKDQPSIDPPGKIMTGKTHGMAAPLKNKTGAALLRDLLKLSGDVPVGRVCDNAAQEILRLRKPPRKKK